MNSFNKTKGAILPMQFALSAFSGSWPTLFAISSKYWRKCNKLYLLWNNFNLASGDAIAAENISGWSPTKIVQMVLIGCICRPRGQKIDFQNLIFKYLLVWNYKAQRFHIWYIASSRGPLQKLFKLYPGVKIAPAPGFTILHWII